MYDAGKMLFELTKSANWQEIAQVLSPEAYELATQWEHLSFERKGELSGYVFGKHGADILIPGAGIKLVKGAVGEFKLLASAANAASKTDTVYVLETTVGTTVKLEASISLGVASKLVEAPFDTTKFLEAGKVMDRGGFTKAGRALMKHGYREGSAYPKPLGNPAQVNAHGQKILEELLNHPERKIIIDEKPNWGKIIDICIPNKGGVRYLADGTFVGLLEP